MGASYFNKRVLDTYDLIVRGERPVAIFAPFFAMSTLIIVLRVAADEVGSNRLVLSVSGSREPTVG
jgi:hypothetical protein